MDTADCRTRSPAQSRATIGCVMASLSRRFRGPIRRRPAAARARRRGRSAGSHGGRAVGGRRDPPAEQTVMVGNFAVRVGRSDYEYALRVVQDNLILKRMIKWIMEKAPLARMREYFAVVREEETRLMSRQIRCKVYLRNV